LAAAHPIAPRQVAVYPIVQRQPSLPGDVGLCQVEIELTNMSGKGILQLLQSHTRDFFSNVGYLE
jgi:hypothetical protein